MKDAPIPLVLDLWSLGHSASSIAEKLGFPNFRHIERIVRHARSINDPRATLHASTAGRLIGRPGNGPHPEAEIVPAITALRCPAGHPKSRENIAHWGASGWGKCRVCQRERQKRKK